MNWIHLLQKRWGQPLEFGFQCNALSQDVFRVTNEKISPQTLRRICGFVRTNSNMSEFTRMVLEKYIGDGIKANFKNLNEIELDFIIPFIKDFFQIPLSSFEDFNYQNACAKIALRIFEKPELLEILGPFLAKNPTAQIYFFERMPFLDGLAGNYTNWLSVYAQEKKDAPAQLYAAALRYYGKKLSNEQWQSKNWKDVIPEETTLKIWHPFLRARASALRIWEAAENADSTSLQSLIKDCKEEQKIIFNSNKNERYFPFFEWILAEALHLIEHFEDSEYFAKLYFQNLDVSDLFPIEPGYHEAIRVIQYRNAAMLGNTKLFYRLSKEIEIKDVIFLGQRYFRIIYNLAQLKTPYLHTKRKKQIQKQLNDDIAVTGYKYFRKFLAEI